MWSVLTGCSLSSANAQVASPQLATGFYSYGAAASGWRTGNTVDLIGFTVEGPADFNGKEAGTTRQGFGAKGPENRPNSDPFFFGAYRGDSFGVEFYSNTGDGAKTDIELEDADLGEFSIDTFNLYLEQKEQRINGAYVLLDAISIGLGIFKIEETARAESEVEFVNYRTETFEKKQQTGLSFNVSFKLLDSIFVSVGEERITETGTYQKEETGLEDVEQDYVDNSWRNSMRGIAFLSDPSAGFQYRIEIAQLYSPESEKKATGTSKKTSAHKGSYTDFISAELTWKDLMFGMQKTGKLEMELNGEKGKTTSTLLGAGWQPSDGFCLSLYAVQNDVLIVFDGGNELETKISGYYFIVGYNF